MQSHNNAGEVKDESKDEPRVTVTENFFFSPRDQRKKLQILAKEILEAVNSYKRGRKLSENRKTNIKVIEDALIIPSTKPEESKYSSPDGLAVAVHNYLRSPEFITGFFNGSVLRDKIFVVLEKDYPLVFLKKVTERLHYDRIKADLDTVTTECLKSSKRIIDLQTQLNDDTELTVDLRTSLTNANDLSEVLLEESKNENSHPGLAHTDLIVSRLNKSITTLERQKTDIKKLLEEEIALKEELKSQLKIKSHALIRAEKMIAKLNQEYKQKQHSGNNNSQSHNANSEEKGNCRQEAAAEAEMANSRPSMNHS
jgi:hypothetical protein